MRMPTSTPKGMLRRHHRRQGIDAELEENHAVAGADEQFDEGRDACRKMIKVDSAVARNELTRISRKT
jgi:hypothetical protein